MIPSHPVSFFGPGPVRGLQVPVADDRNLDCCFRAETSSQSACPVNPWTAHGDEGPLREPAVLGHAGYGQAGRCPGCQPVLIFMVSGSPVARRTSLKRFSALPAPSTGPPGPGLYHLFHRQPRLRSMMSAPTPPGKRRPGPGCPGGTRKAERSGMVVRVLLQKLPGPGPVAPGPRR